MGIIEHKRREKNLTQAQLAELLAIDQTAVSKWETGDTMPRADKLIKRAETFGCTVDELLREPQQESA